MGTPKAMYDSEGQNIWSCELNSYGKVKSFKGNYKTDCPFRYQGQYEDSETGLYYNRFRYYDPSSGVYLSQDPIGLAGNNPTLYGYVKDVNRYIDKLGLSFASWVKSGVIDFNDIDAFAKDRGVPNVFNPDPSRFPEGGFKYEYSDGKYNYTIHGHGTDPEAAIKFPGSNAANGPTASVSRKPISGGKQENLMTDGTWKKRRSHADFNNSHIPMKNSPYH